MKKLALSIIIGVCCITFSYAQNSVGIGTTTPDANAVLDLQSPTNNQGLLIPRLDTNQILAMPLNASHDGMLVYAHDINAFAYWDGDSLDWYLLNENLTGGSNDDDWYYIGDTLYNNSQYVVVGSGGDATAKMIVNSLSEGIRIGLRGYSDGDGAIAVGLQGIANGSITNVGVSGYAAGGDTLAGVTGESDASGASTAFGVFGKVSNSINAGYALFGEAEGTSGTLVGIYGSAFGGTNNWAGFFADGDVFVQNNVGLGIGTPANKLHIFGGSITIDDGASPYTLPFSDGLSGSVLTTDGVGNVSWQPASGSDADWVIDGTNPYVYNTTDNIGIGTASPTTKLDIQASSTGSQMNIRNTTGSLRHRFVINGGDDAIYQMYDAANNMNTQISADPGSPSFFIGSSVGVGTTTPGTMLEVSSPISTSSSLFRVRDNASGVHISFSRNTILQRGASSDFNIQSMENDIVFSNGDPLTEKMRIEMGGNIGIGITAPTNRLHVFGGSITIDDGISPYTLPGADGASGDVLTSDGAGNVSWQPASLGNDWSLIGNTGTSDTVNFIGTTDAVDMVFRTNNIETARLASNGRFGIGDFSGTGPLDNLEIRKSIGSGTLNHLDASQYSALQFAESGSVFGFIGQWGSTSAINPLDLQIHNYYSGNGGIKFSVNGAGNLTNPAMTIANNSNVGIGTTAPTAYSKLHVQVAGSGNNDNIRLQNTTGNTGFGYILQNLDQTWEMGMNVGNYGDNRFQIYNINSSIAPLVILPNGNVGIGAENPTATLDIVGSMQYTDGNQAAGRVLTSDASGNASWQAVSAGNDWSLTGNAGTVDGTNFIGTTDDIPFNIRMNNVRSGRIDRVNENTFFGYASGLSNSTGFGNTFIGDQAGQGNTTGQSNVVIGIEAGLNSNGSNEVLIGRQAGSNNTGSQVTFVGFNAGANNTGNYNTFYGYNAGNGNTSGVYNTYIGPNAGLNTSTGHYNTAVGLSAGANNTAWENVFIGRNSGLNNTSGGSNTFLGSYAGDIITTGSSNTFVGYNSDASVNNLTNATAIGANAVVQTSNTVQLGNNANVDFDGALMPNSNAGVAGEILTSQGAGLPPVWTAAAGGSDTDWTEDASYVYNTSGKNIGIGTSTPSTLLHLYGSTDPLLMLDGAAGTQSVLGFATAGTSKWSFYIPSGGDDLRLWHYAAPSQDYMSFDGANGNISLAPNSGNVGIGTMNPLDLLHVDGVIRVDNGVNYARLYQTGTSTTMLETDNLFELAPNGGGTAFSIDDGQADFNVYTTINSTLQLNNTLQSSGSPGAVGDILTSQGAGVAPVWQSAAAASSNIYNTDGTLTSSRIVSHNDRDIVYYLSGTGLSNFQVRNSSGFNALDIEGDGDISIDNGSLFFNTTSNNFNFGNDASVSSTGFTGAATPSFAYGYNTSASGGYGAVAMGYSATASGIVGIALGQSVTASGYSAIAIGQGNTASADNATALGENMSVGGSNSFGINLSATSQTITNPNTMAIMGGNVGIGTTTPAFKLSVHQPSTGTNYIHLTNNTTGEGSGNGLLLGTNGSNMLLWNYEPSSWLFGTSSITRMEIEADGDLHAYYNVGIGATPSYPLDITANGSSLYGAYIDQNKADAGTVYGLNVDVDNTYTGTSGHTTYGIYGQALNNGGTTSATYGVRGYATGTSTGTKYGIYASTGGSGTRYAGYFVGDVYCTGSYLPSDESLKRNVLDFNGALSKLVSLPVKEYEYQRDGKFKNMNLPQGRQVGIMAQDMENIFPELTKENQFNLNDDPENPDAKLEEDLYDFKSVNYVGLIPITIKAMQEQQAQIETLKAENEELKRKFETQQRQIDELRALIQQD